MNDNLRSALEQLELAASEKRGATLLAGEPQALLDERDALITVFADANELHGEVRSERDALLEACKPFAAMTDCYACHPDDHIILFGWVYTEVNITVGDLRAAHAALAKTRNEEEV